MYTTFGTVCCPGWIGIQSIQLVLHYTTHCDIFTVKNALVKVRATSRSAPFGVSFDFRLSQNSADERGKRVLN
jgi:hypothetical protein